MVTSSVVSTSFEHNGKTLYLWRAWTRDRERIADCGTAWATSDEDARSIGWMCLGGPYMRQVKEVDVQPVRVFTARGG
jgi:hypothetical protein